jgi:hypothetical protein
VFPLLVFLLGSLIFRKSLLIRHVPTSKEKVFVDSFKKLAESVGGEVRHDKNILIARKLKGKEEKF